MARKFEMKTACLVIGLSLVLGLGACGGSEKGADAQAVMPEVVGKKLDVALGGIKSAGFKDDVEIIGGGTFGVVNESNWTVCAQAPSAGQSITSTPQLTVDRSCGGSETTSTTASPTTSTPSTPTTSAPPAGQVLTAATNPDLAALLAGTAECGDTVATFASTYRGQTIEFDGAIANVAPYQDKRTRYDILVRAGDSNGPNFKFEDVATLDLGLTGPGVPESLQAGDTVRVTARVLEFNKVQCILFLDPVAMSMR